MGPTLALRTVLVWNNHMNCPLRVNGSMIPNCSAVNRVAAVRSIGMHPLRTPLGLGILYFLAVCLALVLRFQPTNVAAIWPANGLAVGVLLLARKGVWPRYFLTLGLACLAANLANSNSLLAAAGFAAANLTEIFLVVWLIRKLRAVNIKRLRNSVAFIVVGAVSVPAFAAFLGAIVVKLVYGSPLGDTWASWLVADALGILLIAPLTLLVLTSSAPRFTVAREAAAEVAWFVITFLGMALWIFSAQDLTDGVGFRRPLLLAAWHIWAAMRFSLRGVVGVNLALALLALGTCFANVGPFVFSGQRPEINLFDAQIYVGNVAAMTFVVAAVMHGRRVLTASLHRTVAYLHEIRALAEERALELWFSTAELQAAQEAAEAASRAKGDFLASMSHEIRTPLTAILGYTELLQERATAHEDIADLRTVQRSSEHLLAVINDILDFAKIESGKVELEQIPCRLQTLLDEVLELFCLRAREKKLDLSVWVSPQSPEVIRTDPTRFKQILINLLGNAIKFTREGAVSLRVNADDDALSFIVQDSGIGMNREQLTRLFEPFMQAHNSTRRQFGGTGLGLSISRRLAEHFGGTLTAASVEGSGSVFTWRLPRQTMDDAASHENSGNTGHPPLTAAAPKALLGGAMVLIADDSAENTRLVRRILESVGARVMTADNGAKAIAAIAESEARQQPFDLVLMDSQMPIMDGLEAVRRLRQSGYHRRIASLTADATHEAKEQALLAGCDEFLTKPITKMAILDAVRRSLTSSSLSPRPSRPESERASL